MSVHPSRTSPIRQSSCFDSFHLVTEDVRTLISKSNKKSCSRDPMPIQIVVECLDVLLPALTRMINLSLESGCFPEFDPIRISPIRISLILITVVIRTLTLSVTFNLQSFSLTLSFGATTGLAVLFIYLLIFIDIFQ